MADSVLTKRQAVLTSTILLLMVMLGNCATGENSKAEKNALSKLRSAVKGMLLEDWMNTDEYLTPWIRDAKLDLNLAKSNLQKAMEWRKANNIGKIRSEDFSKFQKDFPVFSDGVDKAGRPLVIYLFGFYDFRKLAVAGELDQFKRYLTRNFEETHARIRAMWPKNVTQSVNIYDLNAFNARQHLCLQCLSIYTYFVRTVESYYPNISYKTFMINVPTVFEQVLQVIRPLFSEHTRNHLQILGLNKEEWSKELLKQIPADQLLRQFGGVKMVKGGEGI